MQFTIREKLINNQEQNICYNLSYNYSINYKLLKSIGGVKNLLNVLMIYTTRGFDIMIYLV